MNIKIILLLGALFMMFLIGCTIQKDIVKPVEEKPIFQETCRNEGQICQTGASTDGSSFNNCCNNLICDQRCTEENGKFTCTSDTICQKSEEREQSLTLTNKERCEQQGKLYFSGLSEGCFDKSILEACEQGGGEWKLFSNGCVDSCGKKPRLCTEAFAWGCDCGATMCYNGQQCINDEFEPYATQQESCEATNGNWQKIGTRCSTIKEVEIIDGIKVETCPVQEEEVISCICPEGEIFTLQGCSIPPTDLLSTIAYR